MKRIYQIRRTLAAVTVVVGIVVTLVLHPDLWQPIQVASTPVEALTGGGAVAALETLAVKDRAPKTGYTRSQFGDGWATQQGCDMRNIILHRDLVDAKVNEQCQVTSGMLHDPYTGQSISFERGSISSQSVQIDHVVALSDAWQKGAQQLTGEQRVQLANDPLELLAVDGPANQQKSDGDAATWLPTNKTFRCQYVARQIAVKQKYTLWVTLGEKEAMVRVLGGCPGQALPVK
jgi:hypothetical protein